jgi:GH25 family lysozyme M1 (1,4-beta-N-acetylmuramidase)
MSVLDLSNNNANPNFQTLKNNGVGGVMLKVSEGATFADPVFADWSKRARAHGLRVGGYHFAQPDGGDPISEARHFASLLGEIQRRDFRPALDLERNPGGLNGDKLEAWSRTFNLEVARLTGTLPMFYASTGWIRSMNFTVPIGAALWLAHWSNDGKPFTPPVPAPWKRVHLHQFTSDGHVSGIAGRVDINQVLRILPLLAHPVLGLV